MLDKKKNFCVNTRTGEVKSVLEVCLEYSCLTPSYIHSMLNDRKPNKTEYIFIKKLNHVRPTRKKAA